MIKDNEIVVLNKDDFVLQKSNKVLINKFLSTYDLTYIAALITSVTVTCVVSLFTTISAELCADL